MNVLSGLLCWGVFLRGAVALWIWASPLGAAPLPQLNIVLEETSVSGLSSGGFMAVQFQVAFSSIIKGAGVVAGGPYFCARDDQNTATGVCSCTGFGGCQPGSANIPALVNATNANAAAGSIDPTSGLAEDRIWMFSGSLDSIVPPPVMDGLEDYYRQFATSANVFYEKGIAAQHAMPTDAFGSSCATLGDPFINDCDYDTAGKLLEWIYGTLNPKNTGALGGTFIEFDQEAFLSAPAEHGMSQKGWAYVPAPCSGGAACKVHIVFHGCKQYPESFLPGGPGGRFGDTYVQKTGYNAWADTNNIVVLYPQANAMTVGTRLPRVNPNGCWDWWGYDDGEYAKKSGRQMAAVRAMLAQLAGGGSEPCPQAPEEPRFCGAATNAEHVTAGRADNRFFWLYFARGSGDFLGFSGFTVNTLQETSAGVFEAVTSCPAVPSCP